MNTDMTVGKPSSVLLKFSVPLFVSVAFQQFYSIADSMIAGNFIPNGEAALAAISSSYPVTMLFIAVATGMNAGCSVICSNLFGSHNHARLKTAVSTSYITIAAVSVLLAVFGLLFCSPILTVLNTPAEVFEDSALYLNIYVLGLPFLFFYNVCNGVFAALGDSRTPLWLLIGSSLGNIVLDLVSVICLNMGIAGVAWATFAAQGVSSIASFIILNRRIAGFQTGRTQLFSWQMLGKISTVAIPSILHQSFVSVGNLFIQGIINSYGTSAMAGYSAAIKLNTFVVTSVSTMSGGMANFTAQNIGAGKLDRVVSGFRTSLVMSACVCLPITALYLLFGGQLVGMFMDSPDGNAVGIGYGFLLIVSPFYFAVTAKLNCDAVLKGAGAMIYFVITTFTDLILRVVLAFIFSGPLGMGLDGVWWSWPIGWCTSAVLSVIFYFFGGWKKHAHAY
ncbi:MAG: MATE family efflux transporter [Ruminiclostridium sp.]|nr:MATE family efflux transporter [Ruminiclostridium sp.]